MRPPLVDRKHPELVHLPLRKLGHSTGYAILCLLIFRALHASFRRTWSAVPLAGPSCLAVVATFLVACLDEYHQGQLPSRSGTFRDVLLDSVGAMALQLVVAFVLWQHGKRLPVEVEVDECLVAEETSNLPCEVVPGS